MSRLARSMSPLLLCSTIAIFAVLLAGCSKEDKIIVENNFPPDVNDPPVIVTYSPTFPAGGIKQVSSGVNGITLQVVVGDPDGLDDISAVTIGVESVVLRRFLLRPDTSATSCTSYSFAPNDTVPTSDILSVPASFPGFTFQPLKKIEGGLWTLNEFGSYGLGFPDILNAAANLTSWNGGCGSYSSGIAWPYYVEPPVIPTRRAAVLSYAEVDYRGILVKVYDKIGASAELALPDLKLTFLSSEEEKSAP